MTNDHAAEEIVIDDEEVAEVKTGEGPKEGEDPVEYYKKQAEMYQGMATRRGTKLNKLKTAKKPETPAPAADKQKELGYDQRAYLASVHEVKHPEDVTFVQNAMNATGRTLEEVMADTFITDKLKEMGEHRATKEATPAAGDRSGGAAKDSVEYWLAKGELPPKDQVELRRKVVNAKIKKSQGTEPFA